MYVCSHGRERLRRRAKRRCGRVCVWGGEVGRVEPSDGQGQVGRDEGVSQFGGEMAWYGAAGEADRPQP